LALYALSDGEETELKEIKQAFNEPPGSKIQVPAMIINDRVVVQMCGVAETVGTVTDANGKKITKTKTRDAIRANREAEVWRNSFTHQELVHINPYCTSNDAIVAVTR